MKLFFISFAWAAFSLPFSAYAGGPDAASVDALAKTQAMLQNPTERDKIINADPTAQTVDAQVKALTGNTETTEDIYRIAGQVLEDLVKETGGDAAKMIQITHQALADPKTFMSHISQQNKDAIQKVSTQIENAPTTRRPASVPTGSVP